MRTWFKIVWYLAIIANVAAFLWFILGATANFQRRLDLVGFPTLILFGIPSLILVVLSILLIRSSINSNLLTYAFASIIIFSLLYLISPMVEAVRTEGWLKDYIQSDPIKITSDGLYEYRIDLINTNQKDSRERLYLKNISTGEEMFISVDINTKDLKGLTVARKNWAWVLMIPTNEAEIYELSTTNQLHMPKKIFLINVREGTAQRLE